MVQAHEGVGTLVLIAFLALVVVNILKVAGKQIHWSKQLSYTAAGLLALQYVFGFGLLSGSHKITAWHYLIALAAIIPVGIEHGLAGARDAEKPGSGTRIGAAASVATLVIVVIAYTIGKSHS